jgi:hypothetical protein
VYKKGDIMDNSKRHAILDLNILLKQLDIEIMEMKRLVNEREDINNILIAEARKKRNYLIEQSYNLMGKYNATMRYEAKHQFATSFRRTFNLFQQVRLDKGFHAFLDKINRWDYVSFNEDKKVFEYNNLTLEDWPEIFLCIVPEFSFEIWISKYLTPFCDFIKKEGLEWASDSIELQVYNNISVYKDIRLGPVEYLEYCKKYLTAIIGSNEYKYSLIDFEGEIKIIANTIWSIRHNLVRKQFDITQIER